MDGSVGMRVDDGSMDQHMEKNGPRLPLREALRLSEMLVDVQILLKRTSELVEGVDIRILSEPKHLDLEHREFRVADLTGGKDRTLYGPVPCARLDDLFGVAREGCRRWVQAHEQRRGLKLV